MLRGPWHPLTIATMLVHSRATMIRAFGLLLAVVGLMGQLSCGSVAQRTADLGAAIAALTNASIDCRPAPPAPDDHAPRRHHRTEPSLCPAPLTPQQSSYTIVPSIETPEATANVARRSGLPPPSRGPPPPIARVGKPRAPPVQA